MPFSRSETLFPNSVLKYVRGTCYVSALRMGTIMPVIIEALRVVTTGGVQAFTSLDGLLANRRKKN